MHIRKANFNDSISIAYLHKSCIPTGFLSTLKIELLDILYKHIIKHDIAFVAIENNKVAGFVVCTLNTKHLYKKFFISNIFNLLPFIISKIFSIKFIKKIIETLFAPFKSKVDAGISENELPELLTIAVNSKIQTKGIGHLLLISLENELKNLNIKKYKVIAGTNLISANKFYLKHGFELVCQIEIHKGDLSNIYIKRII